VAKEEEQHSSNGAIQERVDDLWKPMGCSIYCELTKVIGSVWGFWVVQTRFFEKVRELDGKIPNVCSNAGPIK
jgi:hypothetical protein